MIKSLMFLVFVGAVVCGELRTPLLDAIISGATKIRSGIHNAGEALINGITHRHGGTLNLGGTIQISQDQEAYMNPQPPRNPETNGDNQKTVIYVIEKQGPEPHGYGPGYGPNGCGPHGPHGCGPPPHYGPPRHYGPPPHYAPPGPGFPHEHGHPGRPENEHRPYDNGPWHNNKPNYGQSNQNYESDKNQPNENTKQENKPDYNNNVNDDKKSSGNGQTLEHDGTKTEDGPIHVPLNPNEVNYDGDKLDKTTNNAPKRETSKTDDAAEDDQEYNIDVRFNNNE